MPPKSPRKNFKWTPAQVAKLKAAYAAGHNTGLEVQNFTGWNSKIKDTDQGGTGPESRITEEVRVWFIDYIFPNGGSCA